MQIYHLLQHSNNISIETLSQPKATQHKGSGGPSLSCYCLPSSGPRQDALFPIRSHPYLHRALQSPKGLSLNNHPQGSLWGSLRPDAQATQAQAGMNHPKLLGALLPSSCITQCASCLNGVSPVRCPDFPGPDQHSPGPGELTLPAWGAEEVTQVALFTGTEFSLPCGHKWESHVDLQDKNLSLLEGPGCSAPFAIGLGSGAVVSI